jgi:glycosyltransferase involved in cell wall biosynthesis
VAGPQQFGLTPGAYLLYVSRLEPENNPELVIRAYREVETGWPLAIVGGNPYQPEYVERLKALADPRVVFTGSVYGEGYWSLQKGAAVYVSACEIGGTHPTLVEAMAAANAVLYLDTPENRETMADAGIPFRPEVADLAEAMRTLLRDQARRTELACRGQARARRHYSWDAIAAQYERLFAELLADKPPSRD